MAVKKHGVHFDITAQNNTDRALLSVENGLRGVNKAADAVGRALQGAFVATAAISAGKAFATAAMEAEQASKRLDAVLRATGHSAGLAKKDLDEMADSLAESTQFDDESLRNAMAQLLKFGDIEKDVFREGIKLSVDMAAFMGTDLTSAVQAVGKALASPAEGVGTLERQIGKLNPALEQTIKNLIENNQQAKAQALILDTLRSKIGGAADTLNTGLSKASSDAKKQWDEMLESIGRTEPFQKVAKSGLNFVEQSFRDIKSIVENGDWVEKTLAIMAFAGGMRGMKLSPPAEQAPARNTAQGRIGGADDSRLNDPGLSAPMTPAEIKAWKEMLEGRKRLADEAKKADEERTRANEAAARAELELEQISEQEKAEGRKHADDITLENERKFLEDRAKMWQQIWEFEDQQAEEAMERERIALEGNKDKVEEVDDAAKSLGLTFKSAFEDGILEGKKFSDVLKGLGMDIARIFVRKTITEPFAEAVTGAVKDSGVTKGLGDWFSGFFGGGKAEGGPVGAGVPYLVGERGPELMVPGASGSIVPNEALRRAGAGSGGGPTVFIDARGADREGLRRVEALVARLDGSIEQRALGAVYDARRRGGQFAAAFG